MEHEREKDKDKDKKDRDRDIDSKETPKSKEPSSPQKATTDHVEDLSPSKVGQLPIDHKSSPSHAQPKEKKYKSHFDKVKAFRKFLRTYFPPFIRIIRSTEDKVQILNAFLAFSSKVADFQEMVAAKIGKPLDLFNLIKQENLAAKLGREDWKIISIIKEVVISLAMDVVDQEARRHDITPGETEISRLLSNLASVSEVIMSLCPEHIPATPETDSNFQEFISLLQSKMTSRALTHDDETLTARLYTPVIPIGVARVVPTPLWPSGRKKSDALGVLDENSLLSASTVGPSSSFSSHNQPSDAPLPPLVVPQDEKGVIIIYHDVIWWGRVLYALWILFSIPIAIGEGILRGGAWLGDRITKNPIATVVVKCFAFLLWVVFWPDKAIEEFPRKAWWVSGSIRLLGGAIWVAIGIFVCPPILGELGWLFIVENLPPFFSLLEIINVTPTNMLIGIGVGGYALLAQGLRVVVDAVVDKYFIQIREEKISPVLNPRLLKLTGSLVTDELLNESSVRPEGEAVSQPSSHVPTPAATPSRARSFDPPLPEIISTPTPSVKRLSSRTGTIDKDTKKDMKQSPLVDHLTLPKTQKTLEKIGKQNELANMQDKDSPTKEKKDELEKTQTVSEPSFSNENSSDSEGEDSSEDAKTESGTPSGSPRSSISSVATAIDNFGIHRRRPAIVFDMDLDLSATGTAGMTGSTSSGPFPVPRPPGGTPPG